MYSDWVGPAIAGFLTLWLLGVTILIWKQSEFIKSLFPKTGERDVKKKFEELLSEVESFKGNLKQVNEKVEGFGMEGEGHMQKFALIRFNPYEDTGGDQSFSVALLNNLGDGFVITSLHARSQTRVFAKPIEKGKSSKYRLSWEEENVVKKALEK